MAQLYCCHNQEEKRKLSPAAERWSRATRKKNTIMQFYNESEAAGRQMLISTVRRVLHQHGLRGYRARKKPLLQTQHFKVCLKFAADHINKEKNLGVNSVVR